MALTSELIKSYAADCGFDLCGITTPETPERDVSRYRKWLERGLSADMQYMADKIEWRCNPSLTLTGVKSIIMLGLNYYQPNSDQPEPGSGQVARYARGRDYHKIFETKIRELLRLINEKNPELDIHKEFKYFVDYGPFLERAYAEKAGLGYIGKNSMLITEEYGSWVMLAEILTTVELSPDKPNQERHGHCGNCQRCIIHCPTGAIIAPGVVDANKCISYLTIEKRNEIEPALRAKIGNRIFGCDVCQEVCPHNHPLQRSTPTANKEFLPESGVGEFVNLKQALALESQEQFLNLTAGTALTRPKLEGLKRNAQVCLGNSKIKS
jgi:epoxyqueuosine reductase